MKRTIILFLMLLVVGVQAVENAPWVDMVNCPICSNVTAEKGLSENMTWEHHLTATGLMTVFTVNPEFQAQFDRAKAGMKEKIGQVLAGEKLNICSYCTSVTTLLKNGIKSDNVITKGSDVTVLSSTDQAMIDKIHQHGQTTIDFLNSAQESTK